MVFGSINSLCSIGINKPTNNRVVVTGLEVIQTDLHVVVVAAVGVDGCYVALGGIGRDCANAPGIVGIAGYDLRFLIYDCDYVALKILEEVVGCAVVGYTAYCILVIIQRDEGVIAPSFSKYLSAVEGVGVLYNSCVLYRFRTIKSISF